MGNTIGGGGSTKIMDLKGETSKYKTPIQAMEVMSRHQGYELLESGSVRAHGTRAKPLAPTEFLEPKKVYFLVEQPRSRREPRRAMSSAHVGAHAQERLENLVMARRSISDLSIAGRVVVEDGPLKLRLPRAEVERAVRESSDHNDAANKILSLCMAKTDPGLGQHLPRVRQQLARRKSPLGRDLTDACNSQKRVGFFVPVKEGEIHHVAIAS